MEGGFVNNVQQPYSGRHLLLWKSFSCDGEGSQDLRVWKSLRTTVVGDRNMSFQWKEPGFQRPGSLQPSAILFAAGGSGTRARLVVLSQTQISLWLCSLPYGLAWSCPCPGQGGGEVDGEDSIVLRNLETGFYSQFCD